jgi:hypothetical protein
MESLKIAIEKFHFKIIKGLLRNASHHEEHDIISGVKDWKTMLKLPLELLIQMLTIR